MASVFHHSILVKSEDIDNMNHVNNVVYLRYAQEVAEAHWFAKGTEEIRKRFLWVVLRHEIDYLTPAALGHEILGKTWVDDPKGPKIIRHVEFFNVTINKISARVKTTWCLLDATTLRPKRIEGEMIDFFK
jgi:acyl-CoA thioester hydrolase